MATASKTVPDLRKNEAEQRPSLDLCAAEIPTIIAYALAGLVDGTMSTGVAALIVKGCGIAAKAIALSQLGG